MAFTFAKLIVYQNAISYADHICGITKIHCHSETSCSKAISGGKSVLTVSQSKSQSITPYPVRQ